MQYSLRRSLFHEKFAVTVHMFLFVRCKPFKNIYANSGKRNWYCCNKNLLITIRSRNSCWRISWNLYNLQFLVVPFWITFSYHVGNKANWRISKPVFKKTKHTEFSEKRAFLTPWYAHVRQRVRNVCFSGNLTCFVFLKHPFWNSPICLFNDEQI